MARRRRISACQRPRCSAFSPTACRYWSTGFASRSHSERASSRMPSPSEESAHSSAAAESPLNEYHLELGGHAWSVFHTAAVLTVDEEQRYLAEQTNRAPYGVVLWPSAIALAHDIVTRADQLRGTRVLELGAGTGLPGIVAASCGAHVVQTDRNEQALSLCR